MTAITSFSGRHRFLSNFYPSVVRHEDLVFPTVEHAYQAAKTYDAERRQYILNCPSPADARHAGRTLPIRKDWETVKIDIMRSLLLIKFQQPYLWECLLATGDADLVEGNTWGDRIWGQCPLGVGENRLGKLLVEIRLTLRGLERSELLHFDMLKEMR